MLLENASRIINHAATVINNTVVTPVVDTTVNIYETSMEKLFGQEFFRWTRAAWFRAALEFDDTKGNFFLQWLQWCKIYFYIFMAKLLDFYDRLVPPGTYALFQECIKSVQDAAEDRDITISGCYIKHYYHSWDLLVIEVERRFYESIFFILAMEFLHFIGAVPDYLTPHYMLKKVYEWIIAVGAWICMAIGIYGQFVIQGFPQFNVGHFNATVMHYMVAFITLIVQTMANIYHNIHHRIHNGLINHPWFIQATVALQHFIIIFRNGITNMYTLAIMLLIGLYKSAVALGQYIHGVGVADLERVHNSPNDRNNRFPH